MLKFTKPLIPLNLNKVFFIVLHHTASTTATPEQIHSWHLERGFNGFGYNEYIRKDGTVFIGRGDNIGAQTAYMNSKSYGICVEGNYDIEKEMPQAQFNSLVERIKINKVRFNEKVKVEKHNKFSNTSCPGRHFPLEDIINNKIETEFDKSLKKLSDAKIMNSTNYWLKNAQKGKTVNGEYAQILINNVASYMEGHNKP